MTAAWTVCCDFHGDPKEIKAHLLRWQKEYAHTKAGQQIRPPKGWKILPFREEVPNSTHREFVEGPGWLRPRPGVNTMTPIWARPAGRVRAFAVPEEQRP